MINLHLGPPDTPPAFQAFSFHDLREMLVAMADEVHELDGKALDGWEDWFSVGDDAHLFPRTMTLARIRKFASDISGLPFRNIYVVEDNPAGAPTCGQLLASRDALGLTTEEFATWLEASPEKVDGWLDGSMTAPPLLIHTLTDLLTQQDMAVEHLSELSEMGDDLSLPPVGNPGFRVDYPIPGDGREPQLPREWAGKPLGWVRATLQRAVSQCGVPVHLVGE